MMRCWPKFALSALVPCPAAAATIPEVYRLPGFYAPFSAASHLLGAALFVVLGVLVLRRGSAGEREHGAAAGCSGGGRAAPNSRVAFLAVYACACVFLLTTSGVYHMTRPDAAAHGILLRLDHAAIFVLIAGTFTPVHGLLFRGVLRWAPLLLIWAAAVAGIVVKLAYFDTLPERVGLGLYLTLGWLGTLSGVLLWRRYGFAFIQPLLLGGLTYSVGAAIDFLRRPVLIPGVVHAHDVFHLAVLGGALFHWRFVWRVAGMGLPRHVAAPVHDRGSSTRGYGLSASQARTSSS